MQLNHLEVANYFLLQGCSLTWTSSTVQKSVCVGLLKLWATISKQLLDACGWIGRKQSYKSNFLFNSFTQKSACVLCLLGPVWVKLLRPVYKWVFGHPKGSLRNPLTDTWQGFDSQKWNNCRSVFCVSYRQFYHLEHFPAVWRQQFIFQSKAPFFQNYLKNFQFSLVYKRSPLGQALVYLLPEERNFDTWSLGAWETSESCSFVGYVSCGNHTKRE